MPTRLGMGQFGKARPQWKEIASGYAVIRPESVAGVTEVRNSPEADFWTRTRPRLVPARSFAARRVFPEIR